MISFDRDECQAGTPAAVFIAVIRCYPLLYSLLSGRLLSGNCQLVQWLRRLSPLINFGKNSESNERLGAVPYQRPQMRR